jgi:hypothetical protein
MDIARWALGETTMPPRVFSFGGRVGYDDDGDTPNTQVAIHDYKRAPLIFEVRGLPQDKASQLKKWKMDKHKGVGIGVIVECEKGNLIIPSYSHAKASMDGKVIKEWRGNRNHFANFIDAVRARKTSILNAPIEDGHLSSALCHLGNISQSVGANSTPEEAREKLAEQSELDSTAERLLSHLKKNEVDFKKTPLRFGEWLDIDVAAESIRGNDQAKSLLRRDGRTPYRMPEQV